MTTPADALKRLVDVLDRLAIPYMVGGSVASSIHGIARPTMRVDLVAALRPEQAVGSKLTGSVGGCKVAGGRCAYR